jgi:hypothetical protein
MNNKEIKRMILHNYVDWFTSSDSERERIQKGVDAYVEEDHVDEIGQAKSTVNCTFKGRAFTVTEDGSEFPMVGTIILAPEATIEDFKERLSAALTKHFDAEIEEVNNIPDVMEFSFLTGEAEAIIDNMECGITISETWIY